MIKRLRDWLVVALLRSIIFLSRVFPYKLRMKMGAKIIAFISNLPPHARRPIWKHTSLIYPEWEAHDRKAFTKQNLHHFAQNLMELYNIGDFCARQERFHVSGKGAKILRAQKAEGKGAVCVSGHIGQWEAIRAYMARNGMQMGGLYKQHPNVFYEDIFSKALNHSGPMFHTGVRGMSGLVRILKSGGFISLLHDQKVKGAPKIDFLGVPVHTSTAAADLALKYNVPLIPMYGIRRTNGYDYDIFVEEPIAHSDPETMTRAMNDSLSAMIENHPEQWLWIYDRWRIYKPKQNPKPQD